MAILIAYYSHSGKMVAPGGAYGGGGWVDPGSAPYGFREGQKKAAL